MLDTSAIRARRGPVTLLAAAGAALLLAACGSSGASSATTATTVAQSQALGLSNCMRTHGVPNFPDPDAHGDISIGGTGLDPQSPAFEAAQKECARFQPNGGGGPPQMSESEKLAAFAFAKCMRVHGEPSFPDPTLTARSGSTLVFVLRGMQFAIGPGVNPQSPAFEQAVNDCGLRLPVGTKRVVP